MEILFSIAIFAVGMIAIASLFPAAALMQKKTIDSTVGKQVARNVEALIAARKWQLNILQHHTSNNDAMKGFDADERIHALWSDDVKIGRNTIASIGEWLLTDRGHPANGIEPDGQGALFYWVPVFRDANPEINRFDNAYDLEVYAFVLRAGSQRPYPNKTPKLNYANPDDPEWVPGVKKLSNIRADSPNVFIVTGNRSSRILKAGDWILDHNGIIYRVDRVDPNNGDRVVVNSFIPDSGDSVMFDLWVGEPEGPGMANPCQAIIGPIRDMVTGVSP